MLYGALLIVVHRHDVERHHLLYLLLVVGPVKLFREVVGELLLQRLKLRLAVVVVALKLRHALQVFQIFVAQTVVSKAALHNLLLQHLVVGIGELKLGGACHGGMGFQIVHLIVEQHAGGVYPVEIERDVGQRVALHLHVGLYAAAVAHLTSCRRVEQAGQRVGHMLGVATLAVAVVHGLYAASAGYVVLGSGELQLAVVGQWHVRNLHQALAIGTCAENHGAVVVLQRATRYLAGAGSLAVDQHHDRHHSVYRLHRGGVCTVGVFYLTLHREQRLALRKEHVQYGDGVLHVAATVVAEVYDKLLSTLLTEVEEGAAEVFGCAVEELRVVDVAYAVGLQAVIWEVRHLYGLTRNLHRELLARRRAQHFQHKRGASVAAQVVADILVGLLGHVFAVDAEYDVALAQARLCCRHALIGFVYHHTFYLEVVAYDSSYASIFARHHLLILGGLVLGVVRGVGVETLKHGVYGGAHDVGGVESVYIHVVKVLVYGVEHVETLGHIEVVVLVVLRCNGQREEHHCKEYKLFHVCSVALPPACPTLRDGNRASVAGQILF